jgi:AcrR family transcriptional regulator
MKKRAPVKRRRYDGRLRQAQAAETRTRILRAGSELARKLEEWDWSSLTAAALARQARVSERTVYRHFPTEKRLHAALMHHLEEEAGVAYEGVTLENLPEVTGRVFASMSAFAVQSELIPRDPTFVASDQRRRQSLLAALQEFTATWSEQERHVAAAMLDILWTPTSYERLITRWKMAPSEASNAVAWGIGLLVQAIRNGNRPRSPQAPRSTRRKAR